MNREDPKIVKAVLIGITTVFLTVMLVLPLIYVIYTALRPGLETFIAAVTDKYALHSIYLTLIVTLMAVAVNIVFGLYTAWALTKFSFRGKKFLSTLIDLPLTVSPIIAGLIFVLTFGRQSFLYPNTIPVLTAEKFSASGILETLKKDWKKNRPSDE